MGQTFVAEKRTVPFFFLVTSPVTEMYTEYLSLPGYDVV